MASRSRSRGHSFARPQITLLALVVLLLSTVVLYSRWQLPQAFYIKNAGSINTTDNPFKLRPEKHSSRPAETLTYHWRITSDEIRPDGVLKRVFLINNEFPGPTIEARPGDRIVVEVENALSEHNESISIHWHGLSMLGYNAMDGAASITQAPIAQGQRFRYDFEIADNQSGTFWYHAHSAVQRADGLYGGLVIHGASPSSSNAIEYLLMIGDWYHRSAEEVLAWYLTADSFGMGPVPDSLLINGQGMYDCDDAVPARPLDCRAVQKRLSALMFDASGPVLLRIVNVGAYSPLSVKVSGAALNVLAVDGGNAVESTTSDSVELLFPGERMDVLVSSWGSVEPKFVVKMPWERFKYSNPALSPEQSFDIALKESNFVTSGVVTSSEMIHLDELRPLASRLSSASADVTFVLYTMTEKLAHLDYVPHGNINRTSWVPQIVPLVSLDRSEWNDYQFIPHITYRPDKPLWVDLVVNNLDEDDHPFHLHGHDFYVMSTYSSATNWGSYNPYEDSVPPGGSYSEQPLKKDTVAVPRRGYAVLRFEASNPGIWMFHCHVIWHMASGMAMGFDVS